MHWFPYVYMLPTNSHIRPLMANVYNHVLRAIHCWGCCMSLLGCRPLEFSAGPCRASQHRQKNATFLCLLAQSP